MQQRFGLTVRNQLTCGLHVHTFVDSPEEGVAVMDRIRDKLAVLIALSANSPYWNGAETGFESYRTQAWNRWPGSGPTMIFGSLPAYRRLVTRLRGKRRPDGRGDDLLRRAAGPAASHRGDPGRRRLPAGRGRGADRRAGPRARRVGVPGMERRRRSRPRADAAAADGRLAGQQLRSARGAAGLRNLHPGPGRRRGPCPRGLRGPRAGGAGRAGTGPRGRRPDPGGGHRFAAAAGAVPRRRAGRRRRTGRRGDHGGKRRRGGRQDSSLGGASRG